MVRKRVQNQGLRTFLRKTSSGKHFPVLCLANTARFRHWETAVGVALWALILIFAA